MRTRLQPGVLGRDAREKDLGLGCAGRIRLGVAHRACGVLAEYFLPRRDFPDARTGPQAGVWLRRYFLGMASRHALLGPSYFPRRSHARDGLDGLGIGGIPLGNYDRSHSHLARRDLVRV